MKSIFTILIACLLGALAACGDPKATVINVEFLAWFKDNSPVVGKLEKEDQKLLRDFAAEYERTYKDPNARISGADMPWGLSGKTVGEVLSIAKAYFAKRDEVLAKHAEQERQKTERITKAKEAATAKAQARAEREQAEESRRKQAAAETFKPGPAGEPRIFESFKQSGNLAEGYMVNYGGLMDHYRMYFAGIGIRSASELGCAADLLVVRVAVESRHDKPFVALGGTLRVYAKLPGNDSTGRASYEELGQFTHTNVIGDFPLDGGAIRYINITPIYGRNTVTASQIEKVLSAPASQIVVSFAAHTIYYKDGTQFNAESGVTKSDTLVETCAGQGGAVVNESEQSKASRAAAKQQAEDQSRPKLVSGVVTFTAPNVQKIVFEPEGTTPSRAAGAGQCRVGNPAALSQIKNMDYIEVMAEPAYGTPICHIKRVLASPHDMQVVERDWLALNKKDELASMVKARSIQPRVIN